MSDLIATWRRNLRVLRLDIDHAPQLVDVEPLEVFSVFGRPGDGILSHLKLGTDALIATDANASGALAIPTPAFPENQLASQLIAGTGIDLQGFTIVGSILLLGVDSDGRLQDTPQHIFEDLARLGHTVETNTRNTP